MHKAGQFLSAAVVAVIIPVITSPSPGPDARFRPALGRDQVVIDTGEPASIGKLSPDLVIGPMEAAIFTIDVQRNEAWQPFAQGVQYLPSLRDGTWRLNGQGMVLTWKLRPRRWHDGRPVTCGDYVFSQQVARDDRVITGTRAISIIKRIASVTCPKGAGGSEVEVGWIVRDWKANLFVTPFGPLPRHVLGSLYRQNPSRLAETFGVDPRVTIGDGPYRLVEWRKGEAIIMEAVAGHEIFGTPPIRRVTWKFMRGRQAADALLAGTIDAAVIGFQPALELRGQPGIRVLTEEAPIWEHIDFNLDNPLLRDMRVRQAIAHAVNRTQLSQQLFQGLQPISHTYLPRKHPGYTDAVPRYPYDPARAKVLLRQAGFAPGPDGILTNAAGQRLTLEFNTTAGNLVREQIQRITQQQLREVGIEIRIENFPFRVFGPEILRRRRFKALAMYAWILGPADGCDDWFTSGTIPSEANGWIGFNYPGYQNPEMDRLCREAEEELDESRRVALLRQTAVIFARDLPALPLYYRINTVVAKTGLENFTAYPLESGFEAWNIHTWRWRWR